MPYAGALRTSRVSVSVDGVNVVPPSPVGPGRSALAFTENQLSLSRGKFAATERNQRETAIFGPQPSNEDVFSKDHHEICSSFFTSLNVFALPLVLLVSPSMNSL